MRGPALILILAAGLAPAADEPRGDLDRLQGTWTLVSMDRNGQRVLPEGIQHSRVRFEGDHYTVERGDKSLERGTFRLDPAPSPKTVDTTPDEGPDRGETIRGIYEFSGDTLRTCVAPPGRARPTEFATKPDTDHMLFVYRRATP